MISWVRSFWKASAETKFFIFNWVIYSLIIIATTVYCYAKLNYDERDTQQKNDEQHKKRFLN